MRLLLAFGWLTLLSAAFVFGYLLAEHDARHLLARVQALQTERDMLTEQIAAEREVRVRLERSHQIDVQARRSAQEQLNAQEQEKLRLAQDLAQLKALVAATGHGVVEVRDLVVAPVEGDDYEFSLKLDQLVPNLGEIRGDAVLSLVGRREGELVEVSPLAGSDGVASEHGFAFEHGGQVSGRFAVAPDLEPTELVIEILPRGDTFLPFKRVAAWNEALDNSARSTAAGPEP